MQNNPAIRSLLSIFFPLFHQLLEWLLAAVGVYGFTLADVNATSSLEMAGYVMSRTLLVICALRFTVLFYRSEARLIAERGPLALPQQLLGLLVIHCFQPTSVDGTPNEWYVPEPHLRWAPTSLSASGAGFAAGFIFSSREAACLLPAGGFGCYDGRLQRRGAGGDPGR